MTKHEHLVSDDVLVKSAHGVTTNPNARTYTAVYTNGDVVTFTCNHSEAARIYAREYGVRFLGASVVSVRWNR